MGLNFFRQVSDYFLCKMLYYNYVVLKAEKFLFLHSQKTSEAYRG